MIRLALPILAHLIALPVTLFDLALDALGSDDEHRRADAALLLFVLLLIAGWLGGVFED